MKTILAKSYAKINICLDIKGTNSDGYHNLDMVMLPIELHDSIQITELKHAPDNMFSMDDFTTGVLDHNIVVLLLDKFAQKYSFKNKFNINIHKAVPTQAGLGGGSSNAAFTIKAVNDYLKLNVSEEELIKLSKPYGADIPVFIKCKPARCQGIGEILTPITIKNKYCVLIVKPLAGCATREVYKMADSMKLKTGNVDDVIKALETGDDELLEKSIFNALEEPASKLVPEILEVKQALKDQGLKIVQMSGSGSSVFALSTDKKALKRAEKAMEKKGNYDIVLTKLVK